MAFDDYPMNDGAWFAEPTQQAQQRSDEQTKLAQAKPMIRDLIARLDERIDFYGSIDSIQLDITDDPATYQRVVEANRVIRETLSVEKEYIISLLESKR